jgi:hypothetical protein
MLCTLMFSLLPVPLSFTRNIDGEPKGCKVNVHDTVQQINNLINKQQIE